MSEIADLLLAVGLFCQGVAIILLTLWVRDISRGQQ